MSSTSVAVTATRDQTLTILTEYARGRAISAIPPATGIAHDLVTAVVTETGYDRGYAATWVTEHTTSTGTAKPAPGKATLHVPAPAAPAPAPVSPPPAEAPAAVATADPDQDAPDGGRGRPQPADPAAGDVADEGPAEPAPGDQDRPRIVALCGSTRFRDTFHALNRQLTLDGAVVLAPGVFGHTGDAPTPDQKNDLDILHLHKIDLADEVIVVSPGGYLGDSTRHEITYAQLLGKPVSYHDEDTVAVPSAPGGVPLRTWGAFLCQTCEHTHPTRADCCGQPMTPVHVQLHRRST